MPQNEKKKKNNTASGKFSNTKMITITILKTKMETISITIMKTLTETITMINNYMTIQYEQLH